MNIKNNVPKEPIGRVTGRISKVFFKTLQKKLSCLEIERSFYPLLLINYYDGELTQQDLANKLMTDKVQIVHIVDYLSEKGYVQRIQNVRDRREYKLHVTEKGYKAMPCIEKTMKDLSEIAFKGLSAEQIENLYVTLYRIMENISCLKEDIQQ